LIWSEEERDRIEEYRKIIKPTIGNGAIWTGEKCISRTNGGGTGTEGIGALGNGIWTSDYVKDNNIFFVGDEPKQKCEINENGECLCFNWGGNEKHWNDQ
jgi:hypothetical protein